jgi:hypothetical protein
MRNPAKYSVHLGSAVCVMLYNFAMSLKLAIWWYNAITVTKAKAKQRT